MKTRACDQCGNKFIVGQKKRFCTRDCTDKWWDNFRAAQKTERRCEECGKTFLAGQKTQKFCCREHTMRWHAKHTKIPKSKWKPLGIPTATVGAISELKVASDLLSKGFEVFRALSAACSCDLAIRKNGALVPIEVRTGYTMPNGKLFFPRGKRDREKTHWAIVHEKGITYEPEIT